MAEHHDKFTKQVIGFDVHAVQEIADWIPDRADAFLQMWLDAGTSALLEQPQTSDATASRNFAVALAGNLAWAATALLPAGGLAAVVISFGGAAVGSGILNSSDAWPVKAINTQLAHARDAMSKSMHGKAKKLAAAFVAHGFASHERRDQALWSSMFANVPYNSASALLERMRSTIKRAFTQYDIEYDKWLQDTDAEADRVAAAGPHSSGYTLAKAGDLLAMETKSRVLPEIRKKHPFKVHFGL